MSVGLEKNDLTILLISTEVCMVFLSEFFMDGIVVFVLLHLMRFFWRFSRFLIIFKAFMPESL